jgi:hypothetical protein
MEYGSRHVTGRRILVVDIQGGLACKLEQSIICQMNGRTGRRLEAHTLP